MRRSRPAWLFLARLFTVVPLTAVHAAPVSLGRFCASEPLTTSGGDDLGRFTAELTITRRSGALWVSFNDTMPDTQQALEIGPVPAHDLGGRLAFRFTDNWNATGVGRILPLRRGVRVTLDRTGNTSTGWGDNAGRNYGAFVLTRAACRKVSPA